MKFRGFVFLSFALFIFLFAMKTIHASTGDIETAVVDAGRSYVEMHLTGSVTHTEYRTETYPSTCYREVLVGYYQECRPIQRCYERPQTCREVCSGNRPDRPTHGQERECHTVCSGGGQVCHTENVCHSEPHYRTEAYTCYESRQVPYEVFDYNTDARVRVTVLNPLNSNLSETLMAKLSGSSVVLSAKSNGKTIILKNREDIASRMNGNVKLIEANYVVEIVDRDAYFSPVLKGIQMVNATEEALTFEMGKVLSIPVEFKIRFQQHRFLFGWKDLFEGILNNSQFELADSGDKTIVTIPIEKLVSDDLRHRKHRFDIAVSLKPDRAIITENSQVPLLTISTDYETKF